MDNNVDNTAIVVDKPVEEENSKQQTVVVVKEEERKVGRPSDMNESTVKKLEDALKLGMSVQGACALAKISTVTYYDWCKKNKDFLTQMEFSKQYGIEAAHSVVQEKIIKMRSLDAATWLIERADNKNKQNAPQQNVQVNVFGTLKDEFTVEKEEIENESA